MYLYKIKYCVYRERERKRETDKETERDREISLEELTHVIVGAGKSEM